MSRAPIVKTVASLVALGSLILVAVAGAAAWQGPFQISAPGINAGDVNFPPQISMGALGDTTVGWFDGTGVIVARKLRGQTWSAPLAIGDPIPAPSGVYPGVDAAGNTTTSWTGVGALAVVSDWPRDQPTAHSAPLPITPFNVNDLVVNAAGTVVIVGTSGNDIVVAYRPFNGVFQLHTFVAGGGTFAKPRLAINASGQAVVIFRDAAPGTGLWASVRSASADWGPSELVTTLPVADLPDAQPSVAIDAAGQVFAAYAYTKAAGNVVAHTALRAPGGGWQESIDLSSIDPNFVAAYVTVVVNPSGVALLVWQETNSMTGFGNIQARYGSTGTGIWGGLETVNDTGADRPAAAIGDDGTGVAAWERRTMAGGGIGQGRVRAPGSAGLWGDIRTLSLEHANYTRPSLATDGRGDFATVSAPYDGGAQRALVSAYDAAPPTLSDIVLSGNLLADDPVGFAVTPSDEWSGVGAPAWTFSDGGTASGTSVSHTFPNPGTYTAHVTVSDTSGNSASKDISVTVTTAQASLTAAKFSGKWSQSRLKGTVLVSGIAPRAGNYAIDLLDGKQKQRIHKTFKLGAGAFSRTLKLPTQLWPGTYKIALLPEATVVKSATKDVKVTAPPEGVVDKAWMAAGKSGPPTLTLHGQRILSAHFHFISLPGGAVKLRIFKLGTAKAVSDNDKPRLATVAGFVGGPASPPLKGTYLAVLSRKGKIIATRRVRAFPT